MLLMGIEALTVLLSIPTIARVFSKLFSGQKHIFKSINIFLHPNRKSRKCLKKEKNLWMGLPAIRCFPQILADNLKLVNTWGKI